MVAQGAGQKHMEIPALVVGSMSSVRETDFLGMSTLWFVCVCVCVFVFCFQRLHFLGLFNSHLALSHLCPAKSFPFLAESSSSCLEGTNQRKMLNAMEMLHSTFYFLAGRIMET